MKQNINHHHPTWLEIDLTALNYNINQVQNKLTANTELIAIVKANAYGHGAKTVAKEAVAAGVERLGVATVEEGKKLRKAGIEVPILVLGTLYQEQLDLVVNYDLTPTIYSYQLATKLAKLNSKVKVHLNIDTGMGRIGCLPEQAEELIAKVSSLSGLEITGLYSHFAAADEDQQYTEQQLDKFEQLKQQLTARGIDIPLYHIANSAALLNYSNTHYQAVRMGLILYGLYPTPDLKEKIDLQPVMSWKAKIAHVKKLKAGQSISYGCTYTTSRPTKVATIPVGYHDGYPRGLSNQSEVLYCGDRYPVIGRVCMDQLMVDLTGTDAEKGQVVTLIGTEGEERVSAAELAEQMTTINYEIVCRIGSRVPRLFYYSGEEGNNC